MYGPTTCLITGDPVGVGRGVVDGMEVTSVLVVKTSDDEDRELEDDDCSVVGGSGIGSGDVVGIGSGEVVGIGSGLVVGIGSGEIVGSGAGPSPS